MPTLKETLSNRIVQVQQEIERKAQSEQLSEEEVLELTGLLVLKNLAESPKFVSEIYLYSLLNNLPPQLKTVLGTTIEKLFNPEFGKTEIRNDASNEVARLEANDGSESEFQEEAQGITIPIRQLSFNIFEVNGTVAKLPPRAAEVLSVLLKNPDRVFTAQELTDESNGTARYQPHQEAAFETMQYNFNTYFGLSGFSHETSPLFIDRSYENGPRYSLNKWFRVIS